MTRLLGLLGADLPSELLASSGDNERGYWESPAVVHANDAFLKGIGSAWHDVRPIPSDRFEAEPARRFVERLVELLTKEFEDSRLFVVKDPRISRLIPLWLEAFERLGVDPSFVITIRNPLEVAASLWERDRFAEGHSLLLWLRYVTDVERETRPFPRVFVPYEELLRDWQATVESIASGLALKWPRALDEARSEVDEFLSAKYRHHSFEERELASREDVVEWIKDTYGSVLRAGTEAGEVDPDLHDRVGEALENADLAYGSLLRRTKEIAEVEEKLDRLSSENAELRERLSIHEAELSRQRESIATVRGELDATMRELDEERRRRQVVEAASRSFPRRLRTLFAGVPRFDEAPLRSRRWAAVSHFSSWMVRRPLRGGLRYARTYFALRRLGGFDTDFYRREYPDVAAAGVDPLMHYVEYGGPRGRDPSGRFSARRYLAKHPNLQRTGVNPLLHASAPDLALKLAVRPIARRRSASRWRSVSQFSSWMLRPPSRQGIGYARTYFGLRRSGAFDAEFYLRRYPDVARAGLDPLMHYVEHGMWEGRAPSAAARKPSYHGWLARNDQLTDHDRALIRSRIASFRDPPKFSILMRVANTPAGYLRGAIDSLVGQLYSEWELLAVDDASTSAEVRPLLEDYSRRDRRIKPSFRLESDGMTACINVALAMATGDWIVFMEDDGALSEHALYLIAETIVNKPDATIIYSDSDSIDAAGQRHDPCFKPDWDYDLFLSQNLIGNLSAYPADLARRVHGFREGCEGAQNWDFALRLSEAVSEPAIHHVPFILYHARETDSAPPEEALARLSEASRQVVSAHLKRTRQAATAVPVDSSGHLRIKRKLPKSRPLVSVVIPTKDQSGLLRTCVDGLMNRTDYDPIELVIVDNGSTEQEAVALLTDLRSQERVTVVEDRTPFNFSRLCNLGVRASSGEVCVLLNNDTDVINSDWLTEMTCHALRPEVGAVGAKLYYADDTIQHGGVVLGLGGIAGHVHRFAPRSASGYLERLTVAHGLSCVTAACLATRKEIYDALGGFDESNLAVAFNDVDFCIRVRQAGYKIIWTPHAELYHYESVSRGEDMSGAKATRYKRERAYMQQQWGAVLKHDPFYNPNLALTAETFELGGTTRARKPWLRAAASVDRTRVPAEPQGLDEVGRGSLPPRAVVDDMGAEKDRVNSVNLVVVSGKPNSGKSSLAKALAGTDGWVCIQTDGIFAHQMAPNMPNLQEFWTYRHRPEGQMDIGRYIDSDSYDHDRFLYHLTEEMRQRLREASNVHVLLLEGYVFEQNTAVPEELGFPPERVLTVRASVRDGRYLVDDWDVTGHRYDAWLAEIRQSFRRKCLETTVPKSHYQSFESLGVPQPDRESSSNTAGKYVASHLDDVVHASDRIVDVGCNAGYFCFRVARRTAGSVMGVDTVRRWPEVASHINNSVFLQENVSFFEVDALDFLAERPDSVELIHCASTYHYLRQRQVDFLRTARQALVSGGTLVLEVELANTGASPEIIERSRGVDSTPCAFPNRAMFLEQIRGLFRIEAEFESVFQRGSYYDRVYFHLR